MNTSHALLALVLGLVFATPATSATVTITPSASVVAPGELFTMTITADVPNTAAATMSLAFNTAVVAYVGGETLAPFTNYLYRSSPNQVIDVDFLGAFPFTTGPNPGTYDVARLTFRALAAGSANIVINDDGGNVSGWFHVQTAEHIPATYQNASVVVPIPVPAAALLLGPTLLLLRALRRRA